MEAAATNWHKQEFTWQCEIVLPMMGEALIGRTRLVRWSQKFHDDNLERPSPGPDPPECFVYGF